MPYKPLFDGLGSSYLGADLDGNPHADISIGKDGRVPCEDGSFEAILSNQVLEHVENVQAYLLEAYRLLKPGGKLVLSTHGWWTYHPYPVDLWRWTREGLERTLQGNGFVPIESYWILGPLAYSFQLRVQCWKGLLDNKGVIGRTIFKCISFVYQGLIAFADRITPDEIGRNNSAVYVIVASKETLNKVSLSTGM